MLSQLTLTIGREVKCFTNVPCQCSPATDFQKHSHTEQGRRKQRIHEVCQQESVKENHLGFGYVIGDARVEEMEVRSRLSVVRK